MRYNMGNLHEGDREEGGKTTRERRGRKDGREKDKERKMKTDKSTGEELDPERQGKHYIETPYTHDGRRNPLVGFAKGNRYSPCPAHGTLGILSYR